MAELDTFQTRPLTVQGASWFTDSIAGDDYLWTSGFLNERFSEPVSPLGWSVVRELLTGFQRAPALHGLPPG